MPKKYLVELSDGRKFQVEADSQPSEQDILASLGQAKPAPVAQPAHESSWMDSAVDALPTLGGLAGGAIGGTGGAVGGMGIGAVPGAIGGAALGGTIGASAKQVINSLRGRLDLVPRTVGGQLKDIGASGAVQGAGEAVGLGAAAALRPVAKGVYGLALRPVKSVRDKYGLGNLLESGFSNRVMPTASGAKKAEGLVQESRQAQRGMADAWDASQPSGLHLASAVRRGTAPQAQAAAAAERAVGTGPAARERIVDAGKQVVKRNPSHVKATQMMDMKHIADDIADPAYVSASKGGAPVALGSEAAIAKGASKGYRETLNNAVGPRFAEQGKTTKTLYGLKRAADRIGGEQHVLTNVAAGTIGAGGAMANGGDAKSALKSAVLFRAAMSPSLQAGASFAVPAFAKYAPRALDAITGSNLEKYMREALLAQLAGQQHGGQ